MRTNESVVEPPSGAAKEQNALHIFVNRKKFEASDGVKPVMKGREIAGLVKIPAENAVIRRGNTADSPAVGLEEELQIKQAEHFLVTRKIVEGGYEVPDRIRRELMVLEEAGQRADYVDDGRPSVIYREVPTAGATRGLPDRTDVLVPVPNGYPTMIDLAALPPGSPFLGRVKGQPNQGSIRAAGVDWNVVSYHPHNGGGGPPWDHLVHGFHTYYDELLTWLSVIA